VIVVLFVKLKTILPNFALKKMNGRRIRFVPFIVFGL
jgi:hypothetical protein